MSWRNQPASSSSFSGSEIWRKWRYLNGLCVKMAAAKCEENNIIEGESRQPAEMSQCPSGEMAKLSVSERKYHRRERK
jgi:hypothetical protein